MHASHHVGGAFVNSVFRHGCNLDSVLQAFVQQLGNKAANRPQRARDYGGYQYRACGENVGVAARLSLGVFQRVRGGAVDLPPAVDDRRWRSGLRPAAAAPLRNMHPRIGGGRSFRTHTCFVPFRGPLNTSNATHARHKSTA